MSNYEEILKNIPTGALLAELEKRGELPKATEKLSVQTPMGVLMADTAGDSEHPGIWLTLTRSPEEPEDVLLLAEYCDKEYNSDAFENAGESIMLRVYRQDPATGWTNEEPDSPVPYWNMPRA